MTVWPRRAPTHRELREAEADGQEDEQRRVLDIALDEVGDRIAIVNGVFSESTLEAARIARWSQEAGAAALLVAPPSIFRDGAQHRPAMAFSHFGAVAGASDLPIILFQFQLASGLGYSLDTQMALADEFPTIRATKDACADPVVFERTVRALQGRARPVHVLTTHSAWLYQSLAVGCDGLLSGAGSTVAPLQVALSTYLMVRFLSWSAFVAIGITLGFDLALLFAFGPDSSFVADVVAQAEARPVVDRLVLCGGVHTVQGARVQDRGALLPARGGRLGAHGGDAEA